MKRSLRMRSAVAAAARSLGRYAVAYGHKHLALDAEAMRYPAGRCATTSTLEAAMGAVLTVSNRLVDDTRHAFDLEVGRGKTSDAARVTAARLDVAIEQLGLLRDVLRAAH